MVHIRDRPWLDNTVVEEHPILTFLMAPASSSSSSQIHQCQEGASRPTIPLVSEGYKPQGPLCHW